MAFTKWSFPWSSLWGGGLDPESPEAPEGNDLPEDLQFIGGSLWIAEDLPGTGQAPDYTVVAGDAIGWAPGNMGQFSEPGCLTALVRIDQTSGLRELRVVQSDVGSGTDVVVALAPDIEALHAELFGATAITGLPGTPPAFVGFSANELNIISAHNFSLTDLSAAPNNTAVWDNELSKSVPELRFVSLETHGTVIACMGESSAYPTQAFFLKPTFGTSSATPASEIVVDLRPTEAHTVVADRFHVVETHNRVFLFYYEVVDALGASSVAFFAYTPVHDTFDDDLPYNSGGVVQEPVVVLAGHRPILSQKGARRHPVSNVVVVGVEPEDTEQGLQIHWYATSGYGYTSFGPPEIWDEEEHPHVFGGRMAAAQPDRTLSIISVGWTDARQGGDFPVIASLVLNETAEGAQDFTNFYRTDIPGEQVVARPCLGALYVPRAPADSNPGGEHILRYAGFSSFGHNEFDRGGYLRSKDFLRSKLVLRMDSVTTGVTPAEQGTNGVLTGGVISSSGIVNGALYLYTEDASIECEGFPSLSNDSVSVSCWVFPENSGDGQFSGNDFTIALQQGGDTIVWRLSWNEDLGQFHWRVDAMPDGATTIDSSSLGVLPEKHWYHVTALYNDDTSKSQLYINGFLVSENQFLEGAVLTHSSAEEPVIIGDYTFEQAWRAFQGRIDDFVVGEGPTEQQVQASFHHGLLTSEGLPMRSARLADREYQDSILATTSLSSQDSLGTIYTVALRQVNTSPIELLRNQLVFDVWRLRQGEEPSFMGLIALPTEVHDRRAAVLTETLGAPMAQNVSTFRESFEIKSIYAQASSFDLFSTWHLVYFVRGSDAGGVTPNAGHIYRTHFDPGLPSDSDGSPSDLIARISAGEFLTAMDVVARVDGNDPESVCIIASVTDGTDQGTVLYLIREVDFGLTATATANSRLVSSLLPPPISAQGSFAFYDYASDFGGAAPPYIRGIVSRQITEGTGHTPDLHEGVQLIWAFQATNGASLAEEEQIVSTVQMLLGPEAFVPTGGDFDIPENGLPRQLDEYGWGGVDPFIPLDWLPNPQSLAGESFLFGRTGNRIHENDSRDGNGGLMVYSLARQGNYAVRECALTGPYWSASSSTTIGASAAFSIRVAPGEEDDAVRVYVARPYPDRNDKFSTVYLSPDEASSGGWTPEDSAPAVIPILRRNDKVANVLWTGYRLNTRHMTESRTGARLKAGEKYRYAVTVRWSFPGSVDLTPMPE